jgi:TetR/AcrR family transcriptional regulator, transcriptional repressor for nem operon
MDGRRLHPDLRAARLSPAEEKRHGGHFGTKEAFALEAADRYFAVQSRVLAKALGDDDPWLERYFEIPEHDYETSGISSRMFAGHPGTGDRVHQRWPPRSDRDVVRSRRQMITDALRSARRAGEVDGTLDPEEVAGFLLDAREGAVLQAKVQLSACPLQRFRSILFGGWLRR